MRMNLIGLAVVAAGMAIIAALMRLAPVIRRLAGGEWAVDAAALTVLGLVVLAAGLVIRWNVRRAR